MRPGSPRGRTVAGRDNEKLVSARGYENFTPARQCEVVSIDALVPGARVDEKGVVFAESQEDAGVPDISPLGIPEIEPITWLKVF